MRKSFLFAASIMALTSLSGCGVFSGTDSPVVDPVQAQISVYQGGNYFAGGLDVAGTLAAFVPVMPAKVCTGVHVAQTLYQKSEDTVRAPGFNGSSGQQQIITAGTNAVAAAVIIIAQLALSTNHPAVEQTLKVEAPIETPPTPEEWDGLNTHLASGVDAIHC